MGKRKGPSQEETTDQNPFVQARYWGEEAKIWASSPLFGVLGAFINRCYLSCLTTLDGFRGKGKFQHRQAVQEGASMEFTTEFFQRVNKEVHHVIPKHAKPVGAVMWYEDEREQKLIGVFLGKTHHHVDTLQTEIVFLYPEPGDPGYHGPVFERKVEKDGDGTDDSFGG